MHRFLVALVFSAALLMGSASSTVQACPMCAEANKQDENRPKAYMYSILFMMAMPALIFTGFGVGLYHLHRKQADENPTEESH